MSIFQRLYDAQLTIAGHAITWREIVGNALRLRLGRSAACAAGCGPGRSASSATSLLFTVFFGVAFANPQGETALRPGRPPGVLHHHLHLRLVALAARSAGARRRGATRRRSRPRWATARERVGVPRRLGRRCGRRAVAVLRDRRRLAGAAVVLLVRRLDLRRLDRRDLRDGPRLGRLLAGLDRGRPGRRAAAAALATSTPRPCCTACTAGLVICGFVVWLRVSPRRRASPRAASRARCAA